MLRMSPSCIGELALSCRVGGRGLRGAPMSLMMAMASSMSDEVMVAVVSLVLSVLDGIEEK